MPALVPVGALAKGGRALHQNGCSGLPRILLVAVWEGQRKVACRPFACTCSWCVWVVRVQVVATLCRVYNLPNLTPLLQLFPTPMLARNCERVSRAVG
jgi:hypothetical protein